MRTKPNRPKKKNWKNAARTTKDAIKLAIVARSPETPIDEGRPYWVKSYKKDGSGYWLFRSPTKNHILEKFQKDVDSAEFKMVEMGFDRGNKSIMIDTWKAQEINTKGLTSNP